MVTGVKAAILAALTLDGFLCALGAVLFLPAYLGSTPFPVSGLLAGAVNVLLVRVAYSVSHNGGRAALPLGGFALGLLLAMLGGPGGDVLVLSPTGACWSSWPVACCRPWCSSSHCDSDG